MFASQLAEVERFALADYLVYLAAGSRISLEIEATLARLTGLPPAVVAQSRGRILVSCFLKEYDRANGRVLSRYDGTIDGPDPDPRSSEPRGPDPVLDRAVPAWSSAFVGYVRQELHYETDIPTAFSRTRLGASGITAPPRIGRAMLARSMTSRRAACSIPRSRSWLLPATPTS
jgi:hypothetical protein